MPAAPTSSPFVRRIDAHQHFWRYGAAGYGWIDPGTMAPLTRDFLPDDLQPLLAASRFDASIAVQARQSLDETRDLLQMADACSFIAGVVGWVDLQADDVNAQLERWAPHPKLVGVRHVVQDEPDDRFLLNPAFCRGVSLLHGFDLTYDLLLHTRHLAVASDFVAKFPAQRFVLDHLAKPEIRRGAIDEWARDLKRLAAHPHVMAKLSGLITEADWQQWNADDIRPYLDVAFECFGPDRLMIGSDWPVCILAGDYHRTLAVVTDYLETWPDAARDAVMGGTAAAFWRLQIAAGSNTDERNDR